MDFYSESLTTALQLIASRDPDVVSAVTVSIVVSLWSTLFAALAGVPTGVMVAVAEFPGKRAAVTLLNTLMALPTVVVGLFVYSLISRQGPLGEFGLLFTPWAMVVGQTLLAIPIVANLTMSAIKGADPRIVPTALTLGAGPFESIRRLVLEMRFGIMAALIAAFGRVIAEVGVAMMLGGNIRSHTRTMTTAIAMETGKGEFALGLALGLILMAVALIVNMALNALQQR
ncbi:MULTISPECIES: ABC transporter permease [Geobacter]|uniref:ABC transporter permease n=1 Tax=Geobacter anodireducens TaxID=1340425 RepID=A0ABR9NUT9_9BACT|nr:MULTISPECIES: ABC transporter permease [Geobacter]BET57180.1 ABC transporter permease [Geobacter sp. 60473]ADI85459.1 tungstate ABC transporter, membrane protein [Geobacter sulfurreducens KN400]MBE2888030.1 ABC transporter permease [Geobacter anodireducens]BEH09301.1 ABC transporter permease [Geobacter sulfurreducens subsp. ethanolicus]HML79917.1 ABC transporter permease [Geobacter sulfurreducens]